MDKDVVHIYHIFLIHSSINKHLGCFHVLPIVNKAAMNMRIQILLQDSDFSSCRNTPKSGIAGSYGSSINFWGTSILFSIVAEPIFIFPSTVYKGCLFSTSSPTLFSFFFLKNSHPNRCEVISHCGFDSYFPDDQQCWIRFHIPILHSYAFIGEMPIVFLFCFC